MTITPSDWNWKYSGSLCFPVRVNRDDVTMQKALHYNLSTTKYHEISSVILNEIIWAPFY